MIRLLVAVVFVLIPSVKPNVCPDGSVCPGADPCCSSYSGYRCCPVDGGNCCPDGLYCCAPGYVCQPGDVCARSSKSGGNQQNIAEALSTVNKVKEPQLSQCPSGTTTCGWSPQGEECCPLSNAVCCSDGEHCCPNGYTCDLQKGLCTENTASDQSLQAIVKKVEYVFCPDGGICPDGNTCCMMTTGQYGCCPLPQAVCCSDDIHCCPSGTTCSGGQCISLAGSIPWVKKKPAL